MRTQLLHYVAAGVFGCSLFPAAHWALSQELRPAVTAVTRPVAGAVYSLGGLMGAEVQLAQGVAGGTVDDIIVNNAGAVEYLVVDYDGRLLPVPWGAATVLFDQGLVLLDLPQTRFSQVPALARDNFARLRDPVFTREVLAAFGRDVPRRPVILNLTPPAVTRVPPLGHPADDPRPPVPVKPERPDQRPLRPSPMERGPQGQPNPNVGTTRR